MEKQFFYEIEGNAKSQEALLLGETIFHNANGHIGIRGAYEEGYPPEYISIRGQYINGFYDITDMKQAEALCGLIEKKHCRYPKCGNLAGRRAVFPVLWNCKRSKKVCGFKERCNFAKNSVGFTGRKRNFITISQDDIFCKASAFFTGNYIDLSQL